MNIVSQLASRLLGPLSRRHAADNALAGMSTTARQATLREQAHCGVAASRPAKQQSSTITLSEAIRTREIKVASCRANHPTNIGR